MLNSILLVGRLANDVQVKTLKEGEIVSFNFAFSQGKDSTEFVEVYVRDHLQKSVKENLIKGDKIAIMGTFTINRWVDKNETTRTTPRIYVDSIEFIDVLKFSSSVEEPQKVEEKPQSPRRRG